MAQTRTDYGQKISKQLSADLNQQKKKEQQQAQQQQAQSGLPPELRGLKLANNSTTQNTTGKVKNSTAYQKFLDAGNPAPANTFTIPDGTGGGIRVTPQEYQAYRGSLGAGGFNQANITPSVQTALQNTPGSAQQQAALMQERQQLASTAGQITPQEAAQLQQQAQQQVGGGLFPGRLQAGEAIFSGLAGGLTGYTGSYLFRSALSGVAGKIGASSVAAGAGEAGIIGAAAANPIVDVAAGLFALAGVYSNLREQQRGLITGELQQLTQGRTALSRIISATNAGADPNEAATIFNSQVRNIYLAYQRLKQQTQNGSSFLGDGTAQLAQFDQFFNGGGLAGYEAQFRQSLVNPNPVKAAYDAATIPDLTNSGASQ